MHTLYGGIIMLIMGVAMSIHEAIKEVKETRDDITAEVTKAQQRQFRGIPAPKNDVELIKWAEDLRQVIDKVLEKLGTLEDDVTDFERWIEGE